MRTPIEATGRQWKIALLVGMLLMVVGAPLASAVGLFGVFFSAGTAMITAQADTAQLLNALPDSR